MIYERGISSALRVNLDNDYILVIIGARQTGKTTLLRMLFNELEEAKKKCFYINLERLDFVSLLDNAPENLFKIIPHVPKKNKSTVFIDEIQYLKNPTNFLKYFYDEYKDIIKLVISGSSAFYIDQKFRDSLAGRKRIFNLHTLSFREFLLFRQKEVLLNYLPDRFDEGNFDMLSAMPELYKNDLMKMFSEYSCYGGYPRVVLAESLEEKRMIIEDLVSSNAKKDILESKLRYPERYFDLFKILVSQTGGLLNRNELAKTLQLSAQAVENYLYVMQKSFQIALVRSFHANIRKEIIKMPKVYFFDMGVRNYLLNDFKDISLRSDKGPFLENLVFKQFLDKFPVDNIQFWRTQDKNELDFVVKSRYGFEVKFNPRVFLPSRYQNFMSKNPGISVNVISYDVFNSVPGYKVWGAWGI